MKEKAVGIKISSKSAMEVVQLRRFNISFFPQLVMSFFFYIPIIPDMPLLAYAMGLMSG